MDIFLNKCYSFANKISQLVISIVEKNLQEEIPGNNQKGLCNSVGCYHCVCCGFCEKKYATQLPLSRWIHRYIFREPSLNNIKEPVNALSSLGMSLIYIYHISTSNNTILAMVIRSYLIVNGFCSYLYHRYLYNFFGILDSGSMITPIFIGTCYYVYYLPIWIHLRYLIMVCLSAGHILCITLDSFGSTVALFNSLIGYGALIFAQLYFLNYYHQAGQFWSITGNILGIVGSVFCQKIDLCRPSLQLSKYYLHTIWHLSIAANVEWLLNTTDKII